MLPRHLRQARTSRAHRCAPHTRAKNHPQPLHHMRPPVAPRDGELADLSAEPQQFTNVSQSQSFDDRHGSLIRARQVVLITT